MTLEQFENAPHPARASGARHPLPASGERERAAQGRARPPKNRPRPLSPLSLAGRLLPRPVPDRAQDQLRANRDRHAALRAGARSRRRPRWAQSLRARADARRLPPHRVGPALSRLVRQEPRRRRALHRAAARARLSHGLRHRAQPAPLAAALGDGGGAAVLDLVPHPRLCLDQHPAARRPAQRRADGAAHRRQAGGLARDRHRGRHRPRLFLPAVHGAAALRHAGKDGRLVARSRRRSRLHAPPSVLQGDAAAGAAGRRRRQSALFYPDHRRIRHPRSARRLALADDRADGVAGVLRQPRLAGGLRACRDAAGALLVPMLVYQRLQQRQLEGMR